MTTITVSTAADLKDALGSASAGDVILLAAGNYGHVYCKNMDFAGTVTIRSIDPKNPAILDKLSIFDSSHLTFDNVVVDMPVDQDTVEVDEGIAIGNSKFISITNSDIIGGNAVGGIDPDSPQGSQGMEGINGYPIGRGIELAYSSNIVLSGNDMSGFNKGMVATTVDGLTVVNNDFHDLRSSPITAQYLNNVLIDGNHFSEVKSWKLGSTGDHSDFIHIYTKKDQPQNSENITITNNFFDQGAGSPTMSIFISTFAGEAVFNNVLIDGNVFHVSESRAIALGGVDGVKITNNTILPINESSADMPGVMVTSLTKNALISNNVLSEVIGVTAEQAAQQNIVVKDNLEVQAINPLLPNYVADLFVNSLSIDVTLDDLLAIPGTAADGIGSPLSVFDITPESPNAIILNERGEGFTLNQHKFSVEAFLKGVDLSDPANLNVEWTFGDGSTGTGVTVNHRYEHAGHTGVSAKISVPGHDPIIVSTVVSVLTPIGLKANFNGGFADKSDFVNDHEVSGLVSLVDNSGNTGAFLGSSDSRIAYKSTEELRNNPDFTISFNLAKDASVLDTTGIALYYSGTAVFKIGPNSVQIMGNTSLGEKISLVGAGLNIDNTSKHQYTYSFSQTTGKAALYVDGVKVDEVDGIKGGQYVTGGQLTIGSIGSNSLVGTYDDVLFLKEAVGDVGAAQLYSDPSGASLLSNLSGVASGVSQPSGEVVVGTSSDDDLSGGSLDDIIITEAGNDSLSGNQGDDWLFGGRGKDKITGGKGDDLIKGGGGADAMTGGIGDDVMKGGGGGDTMQGSSGNDKLLGHNGNDTVLGQGGADILYGGRGNDLLTGGSGADIFFYKSDYGADIITDFEDDIDKIYLRKLGLNSLNDIRDIADQIGTDLVLKFSETDTLTIEDTNISQVLDDIYI